jgi:pyrroline-5-carboxylate reductase
MGIKLGIIGGGNMGAAIVRGSIEAGVLSPQAIMVADLDEPRRDAAAALGCLTTADARDVVSAEQIMLAVKPQGFPRVAADLGPLDRPTVVISIMAGLESRAIRDGLGPAARVIRVMPNTPCQVAQGMTVIAPGDGAEPGDETLATSIFDALGRTVILDEKHMHAVTGLSGSGPAYVFLLAEAMEAAASAAGLEEATAALLVRQTIRGAATLLTDTGRDPADLRAAVTSPGGTTEAAIGVMTERNLPGIVADAIKAARDRGAELARSHGG